jgi:phosphonatase-like hydrolase
MNHIVKSLSLVIFDMAGTTVDDVIEGVPLVLKSYDDAFRKYGIEIPMDLLNEQRGKDKWAVISEFGGDSAEQIFSHFINTLKQNTNHVKEIKSSSETFRFLKDKNVRVALNTGFPREVAEGIIEHLGWEKSGLVDAWICSEMVGKSRPDPAMIFELMSMLGVQDHGSVMKIDDTATGIEEGLRAGVITIGVLTGTQSRERLMEAGPFDVIDSVGKLPEYLKKKNMLS